MIMDATSEQIPASKGVAVALSSAFFGFYTHAAFMASLHESGVFPSQVAGTSAGALTALLCGTGMKGEALIEFFMQRGLRTCFWDWLAPLRFPGVVSSLYFSGILSGRNAVKFFRERLGSPRLEDMHDPRIQFAVANLTRRDCEVVTEGDAVAFAVASCAIPGLFCNQVINGERWCDGGVAMHMPFSHWLNDDSVHTIVLHRIEHIRGTEMVPKWPSLSSGFATSHQIITDTIFNLRMAEAKRSGKRIIEILTETPHPQLFPNKHRPALIAAGRASGLKAAKLLSEAFV
jgi:predicted acylesterase/phospholipase RssA